MCAEEYNALLFAACIATPIVFGMGVLLGRMDRERSRIEWAYKHIYGRK